MSRRCIQALGEEAASDGSGARWLLRGGFPAAGRPRTLRHILGIRAAEWMGNPALAASKPRIKAHYEDVNRVAGYCRGKIERAVKG